MAENRQQFNVYLSSEIIKELKHYCIERGGRLNHLVEDIFREYLDRNKKEKRNG